jgi:hypothetical protein
MAKKKPEIFSIKKSEVIELNFYGVRSQDGKWLRSKGQGGYGKSWVDDLADAKLWGNPSAAKSRVTYWANNYPEFGVPELVHITTATCNYLDQSERVEKASEKKKLSEARRKVSLLEDKINNYIERQRNRDDVRKVEQWKDELQVAKKELEFLKG